MQTYKMEKKPQKRKVKKNVSTKGYRLNLKLKPRPTFIEVKEIYIFHPDLKETVLKTQFHRVFRKLFRIVMACDEEASDGDFALALSEIERARQVLKDRYLHQINQKECREFYKKLAFLEKEIQKKLVLRNQIQEMMLEQQMMIKEERGRGR